MTPTAPALYFAVYFTSVVKRDWACGAGCASARPTAAGVNTGVAVEMIKR